MKIDLGKLPEGTKWIAIDEDGDYEVAAFTCEPVRHEEGYCYHPEEYCTVIGEVCAVQR